MDFDPPFELTLLARRHWDRLAKTLHDQGRWPAISQDLLATFCQTLVLCQECTKAIWLPPWDHPPVYVDVSTGSPFKRTGAATPPNLGAPAPAQKPIFNRALAPLHLRGLPCLS